MGGDISRMAKRELLATLRDRYRSSPKKDKSRILDEFIAITGHHRKHGIRLLGQLEDNEDTPRTAKGRRIYDEAVREAVIVIWEAADRICGKRLKAAMPHLVESMERHGHLALDPEVRDRLLAASAATLERLLKPIRPRRAVGADAVVGNRWANASRYEPAMIGTDRRRAFWRLIWWFTSVGRCPDHSSTAWWPPISVPAGPKPFRCWPRSNP